MCYPCTNCGRCGKFDPSSPLYTPPPQIPCLKCGGLVDPQTGVCDTCGDQVFAPMGGMMPSANSLRPGSEGGDDPQDDEGPGEKDAS